MVLGKFEEVSNDLREIWNGLRGFGWFDGDSEWFELYMKWFDGGLGGLREIWVV